MVIYMSNKTHKNKKRKSKCENCGHKHYRTKKGSGWTCMSKECRCDGFVKGGKYVIH